jgi:hypothetical protein
MRGLILSQEFKLIVLQDSSACQILARGYIDLYSVWVVPLPLPIVGPSAFLAVAGEALGVQEKFFIRQGVSAARTFSHAVTILSLRHGCQLREMAYRYFYNFSGAYPVWDPDKRVSQKARPPKKKKTAQGGVGTC